MIGILGGTFDPIHCGHMRIAIELLERFPFTALHLLPCKQPVHKAHCASARDRLHMLRCAVRMLPPQVMIDTTELRRKTASYMIETVQTFATCYPRTPRALIVGMDTWQQFHTWKNYAAILAYVHIIVVPRGNNSPCKPTPAIVHALEAQHGTVHPHALTKARSGVIWHADIPTLPISATEIRTKLRTGHMIAGLVPESVARYVKKARLYE